MGEGPRRLQACAALFAVVPFEEALLQAQSVPAELASAKAQLLDPGQGWCARLGPLAAALVALPKPVRVQLSLVTLPQCWALQACLCFVGVSVVRFLQITPDTSSRGLNPPTL